MHGVQRLSRLITYRTTCSTCVDIILAFDFALPTEQAGQFYQ